MHFGRTGNADKH